MDQVIDPIIHDANLHNVRNQWALKHAEETIKQNWNDLVNRARSPLSLGSPEEFLLPNHLKELPDPEGVSAPGATPTCPDPPPTGQVIKIGIIGGGAAGLFTGLLLDFLNDEYYKNFGHRKVQFQYDILEATNRVGGRLFTYYFNHGDHPEYTVGRRYYDVGAMRFPENHVMKRIFDLFSYLKMPKLSGDTKDAKYGSLLPYHFKGKKEPYNFNNITEWGDYVSIAKAGDPFKMNVDKKIPQDLLKSSPSRIFQRIVHPFRKALKADGTSSNNGWKLLMQYDNHSVRSYLANAPISVIQGCNGEPDIWLPLNYETIQWLETFNGGSEWYDQAFSEAVLESLDFDYEPNTDWFCILGGSTALAEVMEGELTGPKDMQKIRYDTEVTHIRNKGYQNIEIDFNTNSLSGDRQTYNAAFCSVPLGCLQRIDTTEAKLNYGVNLATRTLSYGPTAKVGILFSNPWWIHSLGDGYNLTNAGLGHSDRIIRTCVYPSYNLKVSKDKEAVLLCSYTWQQDALRQSPLISKNKDFNKKMQEETELKKILLEDLAHMHYNAGMPIEKARKLIKDSYLSHYAWDWDQDPYSVGGFAFYGPQQFRNAWPQIIQPIGDISIIGECASPHHAWVVGALESVVHQVHAWLGQHRQEIHGFDYLMKLLEKQPTSDNPNPFQGLPPYLRKETSRWHSLVAKAYLDLEDVIGGHENAKERMKGYMQAAGQSLRKET